MASFENVVGLDAIRLLTARIRDDLVSKYATVDHKHETIESQIKEIDNILKSIDTSIIKIKP